MFYHPFSLQIIYHHHICQFSQQNAKTTVLACPPAKNSTASLKNSTEVSAHFLTMGERGNIPPICNSHSEFVFYLQQVVLGKNWQISINGQFKESWLDAVWLQFDIERRSHQVDEKQLQRPGADNLTFDNNLSVSEKVLLGIPSPTGAM